jgi:hypothetical protein
MYPEPWAVSLNVKGGDGTLLAQKGVVHLTCQFNRIYNGVRLNTPSGMEQSDFDQPIPIDSPLDYVRYQSQLPSWLEGLGLDWLFAAPVFTLEHSFCGWGALDNRHNAGAGSLTMRKANGAEKKDHRVYSSKAKIDAPLNTQDEPTVQSIGISVLTSSGVGRISARIRTFSLSFNHSAEPLGGTVGPNQ